MPWSSPDWRPRRVSAGSAANRPTRLRSSELAAHPEEGSTGLRAGCRFAFAVFGRGLRITRFLDRVRESFFFRVVFAFPDLRFFMSLPCLSGGLSEFADGGRFVYPQPSSLPVQRQRAIYAAEYLVGLFLSAKIDFRVSRVTGS